MRRIFLLFQVGFVPQDGAIAAVVEVASGEAILAPGTALTTPQA